MESFGELKEGDFFIIPNEMSVRLRRKQGDVGVAYDVLARSEYTGEPCIRWVPSSSKNKMTCDNSLMGIRIQSDWVRDQ